MLPKLAMVVIVHANDEGTSFNIVDKSWIDGARN